MASRKCEQCRKVKRCLMVLDKHVTPALIVYICRPCARELGYTERAAKEN